MDQCPYCGETIAPNAAQCPKCGVVLEEGAGMPAAAAETTAAPGAAVGAKKKTRPCPRCERPVPVGAHRCKACGHQIQDIVSAESRAREARFQRTMRLGIAGAVAAVVLVVVVVGLLGGGSRGARREFVKVGFDDLARVAGPASRLSAGKQKEAFGRYAGKFVRWDGRVIRIESDALLVRVRPTGPKPDVRLELPSEELAKPGVAVGARVSFAGRLASFGSGDPVFTLEDGEVLSAKE